jgi:hypothetical protein
MTLISTKLMLISALFLGFIGRASSRLVMSGTSTAWIWNPHANNRNESTWKVDASPKPVSYCGRYNAPFFLCDPFLIIDGTPEFPMGGASNIAEYTAYDFDGMSGPSFYFTVNFGMPIEFNTWRLAGSGMDSYGFLDAVLQIEETTGIWTDIPDSDVSGRDEHVKEGWSLSPRFDTQISQRVRVHIKNKKPSINNSSSGFQLYVKSFNLGMINYDKDNTTSRSAVDFKFKEPQNLRHGAASLSMKHSIL